MWNQHANHQSEGDERLRGCAQWQFGIWKLSATAGTDGIRMLVSSNGSPEAEGEIALLGKPLPPVSETYVRGSELHVLMPQGADANSFETIAGLEVVLLPVVYDEEVLVIESTISLQTQWLDVEPTITLHLPHQGPAAQRYYSSALAITSESPSTRAEISQNATAPGAALLVEARDQSSLLSDSSNGWSIQFFGEFMEKGVIRKIQPWWVWTNSPLCESRIESLVQQLSHRPLPLAS